MVLINLRFFLLFLEIRWLVSLIFTNRLTGWARNNIVWPCRIFKTWHRQTMLFCQIFLLLYNSLIFLILCSNCTIYPFFLIFNFVFQLHNLSLFSHYKSVVFSLENLLLRMNIKYVCLLLLSKNVFKDFKFFFL
jgi:hypothetical protein